MPEGLDSLPVGLQVLATFAAVAVGGGVAFFGFTKKWLDKVSPKQAKTTDTVVVSAAFADGKPIKELTEVVTKMGEAVIEVARSIHDSQHRTNDSINRLADRVQDLVLYMRDRHD